MPVINPAAYGNPGLPNFQQPQPTYNQYQPTPEPPKSNSMIFVRGINEAANYPAVQPVLLMDANDSVFYIKDQNGLRVFDYTERIQNGSNSTDFVTRSEFDELKKMIDELTK